MFSLESLHPGDSNEYTQYTIFKIKKKITLTLLHSERPKLHTILAFLSAIGLNYPKSAAMGFFPRD